MMVTITQTGEFFVRQPPSQDGDGSLIFMLSKNFYSNGRLESGSTRHTIINPATEKVVGSIALATKPDAINALEAAQSAFPTWSKMSTAKRAAWMLKLRDAIVENAEHLIHCIHLEMAKPWAAATEDCQMLIDSLEYYADLAQNLEPETLIDREGTHTHILKREPIGVVAAYLAWNFPLLNLAYKLGPAMASGCPIVIKPSMQTPLSAYAVGELCEKIGLPKGVVNIICGSNSEIGDTISASTIPAMLTLIGSTPVGLHVMRTGTTSIKRYSMELGGNAPVLVFPDADLNLAADIVCALKFGNSGQICVTPNRVFVHKDVAQPFEEKIVARAKATKVGFDKDGDIDMGPVIDGRSWARIDKLIQDAIADGAELLAGGGRPEHLSKGHFYAPTVLGKVKPEMRVAHEEIFGPVINLMTFQDEAAVTVEANNTDAGLTAYIFTNDQARADRLADNLQFGEVQINGVKYAINLPHCGLKQSGIGLDCSPLALDEYMAPKRISRAILG